MFILEKQFLKCQISHDNCISCEVEIRHVEEKNDCTSKRFIISAHIVRMLAATRRAEKRKKNSVHIFEQKQFPNQPSVRVLPLVSTEQILLLQAKYQLIRIKPKREQVIIDITITRKILCGTFGCLAVGVIIAVPHE